MSAPTSVFAPYQKKAWPYRFYGKMIIPTLVGGTPTDENVIRSWIESTTVAKNVLLQEQVAQTMLDRGLGLPDAITEVALKHLNGFKRDKAGLYIEGRQLKACIKEAASVARSVDKLPAKWGTTNKGITGFVAEHIQVEEDRLHVGVKEADGILQRFIKTFRGTGIQHEEYVSDATVIFTVSTDYQFTEEEWAMLWLTAEQQGIGASRSQGYGRFTLTDWKPIRHTAVKRAPKRGT